jgi:ABC-type lipoprotein export system ATPase subunit
MVMMTHKRDMNQLADLMVRLSDGRVVEQTAGGRHA